MNAAVVGLQRRLAALGLYLGAIDGAFGSRSRQALLAALTSEGARIAPQDLADAAQRLGVTPAHVGAVYDVESNGAGFDLATGLPVILYEPHVFHRLTQGRFAAHSAVSYPHWGARPYPKDQKGRWEQLLEACALEPEAALRSASWGLFQLMGFHAQDLGYADAFDFSRAMAAGEREQLMAFVAFVLKHDLEEPLRRGDWAAFAEAFNGKGFRANRYDQRLAAAFNRRNA